MQSVLFGTDQLPLPPAARELPLIARDEPAAASDAILELRQAVGRPVSGPSLDEFAAGRRLTLVVPDATRPLPGGFAEHLIAELGSSLTRVRVANGTHRRTTEAEHRAVLGRWFGKVPIGDRDCEDPSAHRACGPVQLDAAALDADALVLVGPASFHYLAGFGGGGKLIAPGLADRGGAELVHRACLAPGGGRHPGARAGVAQGNPLREQIEQICQCAPPQLYVIPLLDSRGRVTRVVAGERRAAFAESCRALLDGWGVPCRRFSTVIASSGGHPYDVDFVQAHKALEAAAAACRPGGTIVWVARCPEGMPARHRAFLEQHKTAGAMEKRLRERFDIAAHTVWAAREKAERLRIRAVTGLAADLVRALGMEPFESLPAALDDLDLDDAALLPFGARFLPLPS
jgi:nickel-dependent lactate racemase